MFLKLRKPKKEELNKINGETNCFPINKFHKMTNKTFVQIFYLNHNPIKFMSKNRLNNKILKYIMTVFLLFFMKKITFKYFFKLRWTL